MDGVLNVLKPPGMTSHDVVSFARRIYKERRVGHGGTLDPQAAGVLILCMGQAARLLEFVSDRRKRYLAEMTLGTETDTQDAWGQVVRTCPWAPADLEGIYRTARLLSEQGEWRQKTPAFSAVKQGGVPMYERARKGLEVQDHFRQITIYALKVLDIRENKVKFLVDCSKGAYIRTLCHDWGQMLGVGAHMSFLLRLSVGDFDLDQSHTLEEIEAQPMAALKPKECLVAHLPQFQITDAEAEAVRHGQAIRISEDKAGGPGEWIAAMTAPRRLTAVGKAAASQSGMVFKPHKVFHGVLI
jgi:tRNA pseudouridine55 synthase